MEGDTGKGLRILEKRTRILRILLIVTLAVNVVYGSMELGLYVGILDPIYGSTAEILAYTISALTTSVAAIATIIVFAMWIHRAAANIRSQEIDGFEYTPGWAVGWYFIPIANLFKPFQAMRQIWNASHGATGHYLNDGNRLLTGWWASWLISNFLANAAFRLSMRSDVIEPGQVSSLLTVLGVMADLVLYPIAIKLVTDIDRAQQRNFTRNMFA